MKKIFQAFKKKFFGNNQKKSKNPLEHEQHIEELIEKIVHTPEAIYNLDNNEIKLLESCLHPSIYNNENQKLPLWVQGKITCFFNIPNIDKKENYVITEVYKKYQKKFSEIKIPSTILSLQDLEIPQNKKFKSSYSKKELSFLGKQKKNSDPLGLFVTSRLPNTKLKMRLKHKNKITEVIFAIGGWHDKLLQWQLDLIKTSKFTTKQSIATRKEFSKEFFFSGLISNERMQQIKSNKDIEYKPKTLIQSFLELDSEYPIHKWGKHLINRLEAISKNYKKSKKIKLSIYQGSYTNFFFNWAKSKRVNDLKTVGVASFFKDEYLLSDLGSTPKEGDLILSMSLFENKSKDHKIKNQNDLNLFLDNIPPGTKIDVKLKRKDGKKYTAILKTKNFNESCKMLIKVWGKILNNYTAAEMALVEYKKSKLIGYPEFSMDTIINSNNLEIEDTSRYKYEDDVFPESEKESIIAAVEKDIINNKNAFVVNYSSWPNISKNLEGRKDKLFLKVYVFDITDLDNEEYKNKIDNDENVESYFKTNCHIIKTNNPNWSEGDANLVQVKEIKNQDDLPKKLAFPYDIMSFPKSGKRRLSFRTFICTDALEFSNSEGRPMELKNINYRAEEFFISLNRDEEYEFDPYNDYEEIYYYDSANIAAEYKQPGYLDINQKELEILKIPLLINLVNLRENNLKKIFDVVKEEINYEDNGYELKERLIYKTLNLVNFYKNYGKLNSIDKIDFKELRNKTKIDVRYNILDTLLNIAVRDNLYYLTEDKYINHVTKNLELDFKKINELKKIKTLKVKYKNFEENNRGSLFGINSEMTKEEKNIILRTEYSRWNALTNNTDITKREKARRMRDLAAKLRYELHNQAIS